MGKWLAKYKNPPEMPIPRTDNTDVGSKAKESDQTQEPQEVNFQAEAAKVRAVLKEHGMARIYSETLDDAVFFCRDDREARRAPAGTTVYTLAELEELARGNPTREALRRVHAAKKIFNGTVKTCIFKGGDVLGSKSS